MHAACCQNALRAHGRTAELVSLYKSRGLHKNALDLLSHWGQTSGSSNTLFGTAETVRYLQELAQGGGGSAASGQGQGQGQGQSAFLDKSARLKLILEFSKWVLQLEPESGLRIFTHSHTAAKGGAGAGGAGGPGLSLDGGGGGAGGGLSPGIVLEHLKKSADTAVCIAYLESLINVSACVPACVPAFMAW